MGLRKGQTNNPNGRPTGVPNRMTKELRKILKDFISGELEKLPRYMRKLPKTKRIEILVKLLPYILPKIEAVDCEFDEGISYEDFMNGKYFK